MNVLVATGECVPFAKTGGLADVCGALPAELARAGHRAAVILPAYRQVHFAGRPIEPLSLEFIIPIGGKTVTGRLLQSSLPNADVPVYLVAQDEYFDRDELYQSGGEDYVDNCERFVFFCRAVMEAIRLLDLQVDVLHLNDWQTGLAAAYLDVLYRHLPRYQNIACLMTLHNLAYQGIFWHWDMLLTGLDWKYFNWHQMEFHDRLNLLKTGIIFADSISTVSPRYAKEIQTHPLGCGLDGVLTHRRDVLAGIVNGVDYRVWDPAHDPHLAANYGVADWRQGKITCKAALQGEMGLPQRPDLPLIGYVGRLADQKGIDLLSRVVAAWTQHRDVQWVLLGEGEPEWEQTFRALAARRPDRLAVRLDFCDPLAHRIQAGCDVLVMPSRYEPCGLSQLYALKYGTVPVVHGTGGLANTVTDVTAESLARGTATGFQFHEYSDLALDQALHRACNTWSGDRDAWAQLVNTGMRQDWSWARSAAKYVELYKKTIARSRQLQTG